MNATLRLVVVAALTSSAVAAPRGAWAQAAPGTNPGQFGGSAPGQFDPNAQPGGTAPGGAAPGAAAPGAAPAPSPFGDMNAGGLTPPPPEPAPTGPDPKYLDASDPSQQLDTAKDEDSGRGLTWFWIEAGGGFEHVGLQTIDAASAIQGACDPSGTCAGGVGSPLVATTGTGAMIDGGIGFRLVFLTLGARGRMGFFEPWDLARLGGELGIRIPIGPVEPRIDAGFGYATLLNVSAVDGKSIDPSVTGYYARAGGGLDVFPSENFSLGGEASMDFIGLSNDFGALANATSSVSNAQAADKSSAGLGFALTARLGLHL